MRRWGVIAVLVLAACAAEEKPPSGEAATARALEVVRELFSARVLGDGTAVPEATVEAATPDGIAWSRDGETRRLVWADVESVESQEHTEKPSRPETLYLYLARGARSIATAKPAQPPLSGTEVVRSYVELRDRPAGSRARLVRALEALGRARRDRVAPVASAAPAPVAPVTTGSVEERLEQLREWRRRGLIDDEVWREEQRKVLSGTR